MRKTICIILSFAVLFALFITEASAEEPIQYGVDTTFLLSIPNVVTATNETEEKNVYTVSLSNVQIPYGMELKVKTTYNNELKLTDETSVVLNYNLWVDEETDWQIESGDMIMKVPSDSTEDRTVDFYGIVDTTAIYSGKYTGIVTFQVLIEDVVTDYSAEEIAASDYLFGIGKTQNNSVVAEFNEDFSSVVITKNGSESDGVMNDWSKSAAETDNPFIAHKDTLRTVDIKNGVTHIGNRAFFGCENLVQELTLPNSVESVGVAAFKDCSKINALDLSDGVTTIKTDAFNGCSSIEGSLNLGGTTEFIGDRSFANLGKATALNLGENVGFIGTSAFENDSSIANTILLPDSLKVIGDYAFSGLTSAANTEIALPNGIEHIGGTAYNKPLTGFDTIESNPRLGEATYADYNATALKEGEEGYDSAGYTLENYKTAAYADTGAGVFANFGANNYTWLVGSQNEAFKAVNGVLYSKDGTRLIDCNNRLILEIPEGVTSIDEKALAGQETITLPDSYIIKTYPEAPISQRSFKNSLMAAIGENPLLQITLRGTNTNYTVYDNNLYSADGKNCYYMKLDNDGIGTIAEGCERCEGIFTSSEWYKENTEFTSYTLNIPSTLTFITNYDSVTNPGAGDIATINALVDNTEKPLTVNIAAGNTAYEVNTDGHIVTKES